MLYRWRIGGAYGYGTVFTLRRTGGEHVLFSFRENELTGGNPYASLTRVGDTFYGTTFEGGVSDKNFGTVFSISPAGVEKVLHSFRDRRDGAYLQAGVIDVNGKLYGTTENGGGSGCSNQGCGTVFWVSPAGDEHVIYRFNGDDGSSPRADLLKVGDKLYGKTYVGGSHGDGTVFSVTLSGTEEVIHGFKGGADGVRPVGRLIDVGGTLYGLTQTGGGTGCGGQGCGTVYSVTP
ncbi:MAG: choice-of-anchor tandem repeat GloVer-containing protein [Rhizomicrobium sp.]